MATQQPQLRYVEIKAIGRNANTIDIAQMDIPPEPTQKDRTLRDEQQVLRVELLMMKGVQAKHQLMELLGIENYRQLDRYIERVHARWELDGTVSTLRRDRGEGLHRLDVIENELWTSLSSTDDYRVKQKALKNLVSLQRLRNDMIGLSASS